MTSARLLAAAAVVAVLCVLLAGRSVSVPAWTLPPAVLLPLGLYGWAAGLRGAYRHERGERGWLLERERERAALAAIESERSRIATEMHDIVSHNVSVMVIQAGAARQRAAGGTENGLVEALQAVESCGRDAMAELRHLLGVLTPSGDGGDLTIVPQPSMGRLGTLIDKISFAGLPVEVSVAGTPRPLPPALDATAFRVVQEALTNALKHADKGARAEVLVRYTDRNLRLEILNTGPSVLTGSAPRPRQQTTGRGLIGLRERVAIHGGDLDARRRLGGGYRIRARIPLERP